MTYSDTVARLKALSQTPTEATDKTDKSPPIPTQTHREGTDKTDKSPSVSSVSAVLIRRLETCDRLSGPDRQACIDDVIRAVEAEVQQVSPAGIGRWSPAWEIVEKPSQAFLDTLDRWEHTDHPTELDRAALADAIQQTLRAWARATRLYREAHATPTDDDVRTFHCIEDGCRTEVGGPNVRCAGCVVARHQEMGG